MAGLAECWNHALFKDIITKVTNTEIYYRALDFYIAEHPLLLNDLLLGTLSLPVGHFASLVAYTFVWFRFVDLSNKLDHSRVVSIVRTRNHLPLIQKYLLHVQHEVIVI